MRRTYNLGAGDLFRIPVTARFVQVVSVTGADTAVGIAIERINQMDVADFGRVSAPFKYSSTSANFEAVILQATLACAVDLIISDEEASIGIGGSVVSVSGLVSVREVTAGTVSNHATVAASPVIAVALAADATRYEARFTNLTGDPVALGAAGLTWATRCIVLNAGDTWVETRAPGAAWSVITDAAKAATIGIQELKA